MQHQCLPLSAKKNKKEQNTEVMKFNSRQFIHYLKVDCSIEVDDLTVA